MTKRPPKSAASNKSDPVQSVARALDLLETLHRRPTATIAELAAQQGCTGQPFCGCCKRWSNMGMSAGANRAGSSGSV